MSAEVYSPEGFPGAKAYSEVGTVSNGRLRWAPDWYPDGWANEEQQQAFRAWLAANPEAKIPTDGRECSAEWLLARMEQAAPSYNDDDLRGALRRYGWLT